jgi:stage V sporulation protein SpoVS
VQADVEEEGPEEERKVMVTQPDPAGGAVSVSNNAKGEVVLDALGTGVVMEPVQAIELADALVGRAGAAQGVWLCSLLMNAETHAAVLQALKMFRTTAAGEGPYLDALDQAIGQLTDKSPPPPAGGS